MEEKKLRIVLCGSNSYEKKYFFNKQFDKLPENIKEELHIMCVLFTEEVGGIFTISFTETGEVEIETQADEGDLLYDDIGSEMLIKEIRKRKKEVFKALSIYFKVTYLHEDAGSLLNDEEEEEDE